MSFQWFMFALQILLMLRVSFWQNGVFGKNSCNRINEEAKFMGILETLRAYLKFLEVEIHSQYILNLTKRSSITPISREKIRYSHLLLVGDFINKIKFENKKLLRIFFCFKSFFRPKPLKHLLHFLYQMQVNFQYKRRNECFIHEISINRSWMQKDDIYIFLWRQPNGFYFSRINLYKILLLQ
jgi:hypothetical protein